MCLGIYFIFQRKVFEKFSERPCVMVMHISSWMVCNFFTFIPLAHCIHFADWNQRNKFKTIMFKTLPTRPHSLMSIHVRDMHVRICTCVGGIWNASLYLMRSLLQLINRLTGHKKDNWINAVHYFLIWCMCS